MAALMSTTRSWIALVAIIAAVGLGFHQFGTHRTPDGQPALVHLDVGSLDAMRADFNAASDSIRLLVLLAPT
jgi:hypothetical protein